MTEKNFKLGKAERFALEYLFENELNEKGSVIQKEILDKYNKLNNGNVVFKSFKETMERLVKKELVGKGLVGKNYYYRIAWKGIIICDKLLLS